MTQEEKVREIANTPVEDLGEDVDSFFYKLCKRAYNLGIQEAADNVEMMVSPYDMEAWEHVPNIIKKEDLEEHEDGFEIEIDRNSILKLKI